MELYNLYQSILYSFVIFNRYGGTTEKTLIGSAVIAFLIWGALFVLQGVGLSVMAKNRGVKNRYLAFIPFANLWYLGKLAGDCEIFGRRMKNPGVYAMIAQIATTALCVAIAICEGLLFTVYASNLTIDSTTGMMVWTNLTGTAKAMENFYSNWGDLLCSIVGLVYEILIFLIMISLLKKYYAKNYMMLAFVQLFVPLARYIIIFVVRKNKAVDYNEYMRSRYEEFARRQQAYRGNPYGPYGGPYGRPYGNPNANPYGNPQNPYGNPQRPQDDPFGEFSNEPFSDMRNGEEKKASAPFGDFSEQAPTQDPVEEAKQETTDQTKDE